MSDELHVPASAIWVKSCSINFTDLYIVSTESSSPKPLIPDGNCTPAAICNQSKLRHLSPFLLQGSISWAELWQASSLNYSIANCPCAALLLWPYQNFINSLIKQEVEKGRRPLGSAMWVVGRLQAWYSNWSSKNVEHCVCLVCSRRLKLTCALM